MVGAEKDASDALTVTRVHQRPSDVGASCCTVHSKHKLCTITCKILEHTVLSKICLPYTVAEVTSVAEKKSSLFQRGVKISAMCDLEVKVVTYKFWSKAESAWKSNISDDAEVFFSLVTSMEDEDDDDKGEEMESVVLMVREGRDLLQHLQLSPWPQNLPAVSICVGARSLLVQTDCAEGGIKFLVELEEGEEGLPCLLILETHLRLYLKGKYAQVKKVSPTWLNIWLDLGCQGCRSGVSLNGGMEGWSEI